MIKAFIFSILAAFASSVQANNINIIVPFAAGGAFDIVARQLAAYVETTTNRPVTIQNVTGAGSLIGTRQLLRSPANTLMVTSSSFYATVLENDISFDDFRYPALLGQSPLYLAVSAKTGLTCEQLRNRGRKFFIGNAGRDSITSIGSRIVVEVYPNYTEVPYRGIAQSIVDVVGGQIDATFLSGLAANRPELTILANTSDQAVDGVPTLRDCLEVKKTVQTHFLVVASPGSSTEFLNYVNQLVQDYQKLESTRQNYKKQGIDITVLSVKQTEEQVRQTVPGWQSFMETKPR